MRKTKYAALLPLALKILKRTWWWPFFIKKTKPFEIPITPQFIKTFEARKSIFFKTIGRLFKEKILPGVAIGISMSALNAVWQGIKGLISSKQLEKIYLNSPELAGIPKTTKKEALKLISKVAPSLSLHPGVVIPFIKQYHITDKQIALPTLEILSKVEGFLTQREGLPSVVRRNLESVKIITELSDMLKTLSAETPIGLSKEAIEKHAEIIGGIIGMLIGLLFAKYTPEFLKEKVLPFLIGIGGFGIGSLLEHRARQRIPQIIYPHRHPYQIPTFPYTL